MLGISLFETFNHPYSGNIALILLAAFLVYKGTRLYIPQVALRRRARLSFDALMGMYSLLHRQNRLLEEIAKKQGLKDLPKSDKFGPEEGQAMLVYGDKVYGDKKSSKSEFRDSFKSWFDNQEKEERTVFKKLFDDLFFS